MIPEPLSPIANHLWQSTLFAGAAGLLTLALRKNAARIRQWVWVAASLKFLVPFSVLVRLGSYVQASPAAMPAQNSFSMAIDQVSRPFTPPPVSSPFLMTLPPAPSPLPGMLWTAWACVFMGICCSWWWRWRRVASAVRTATPLRPDLPIRAVSPARVSEPGVYGLFRPVLLLPEGILERLTPLQINTVVAHELCHVRHRDNLIAVIQMFIESVFWFHPLVWWIGKRMSSS